MSDTPRRYRKRPLEVCAIQWTGENWPAVEAFVGLRPDSDGPGVFPTAAGDLALWIEKSNTWRPDLPVGDWVIAERGGIGFYPCTVEQFEETYEPVDG